MPIIDDDITINNKITLESSAENLNIQVRALCIWPVYKLSCIYPF